MFTYLGASTHLSVEDIDESIIKSSRMTYVEGYLWEDQNAKEAIIKAAEIAHKYNRDFVFSCLTNPALNATVPNLWI